MLWVPAAHGQSPLSGPTLQGSHRSAPAGPRCSQGTRTVGSTHGYSCCSPSGSTEGSNLSASHWSNQWLAQKQSRAPAIYIRICGSRRPQVGRPAAQAYALAPVAPGSGVRGRARQKLNALLTSKLATARAWELKETFAHFWSNRLVFWAGAFLHAWCGRAMRSRLEPMKKVARMLRAHEPLLLNWFRAKGEISAGAVEGLNNKIRVMTRRSYGFDREPPSLHSSLRRSPFPGS